MAGSIGTGSLEIAEAVIVLLMAARETLLGVVSSSIGVLADLKIGTMSSRSDEVMSTEPDIFRGVGESIWNADSTLLINRSTSLCEVLVKMGVVPELSTVRT